MTDERRQDLMELRQILYWRWDPLGVSDSFPLSGGEYDQYAAELLSRLEAGAREDEVTAYLEWVEREWITVGAGSARERGIGEAVAWWFHCRRGTRNEARHPTFTA
jgi:hypothetical protein